MVRSGLLALMCTGPLLAAAAAGPDLSTADLRYGAWGVDQREN